MVGSGRVVFAENPALCVDPTDHHNENGKGVSVLRKMASEHWNNRDSPLLQVYKLFKWHALCLFVGLVVCFDDEKVGNGRVDRGTLAERRRTVFTSKVKLQTHMLNVLDWCIPHDTFHGPILKSFVSFDVTEDTRPC